MSVDGVKVADIVAVNNLKHAWQFVLENVEYPVDYPFICRINRLVDGDNLIIKAGFLRNMSVSIGGTTWKPDLPIEAQIKEQLDDIRCIESPTERAITLMLYIIRKQIFLDGNKRTAMLAANAEMIASGCRVITVPIEKQCNFTALLVSFYESGDMIDIKKFIYDECIDGIDFQQTITQNDKPEEGPKFGGLC